MKKAKLILDNNKSIELPVVKVLKMKKYQYNIAEKKLDILPSPGYGNTGACISDITFIDGKKEYCDIEVIQLKSRKNTNFTDLSYLLIYGDHDDDSDLIKFKKV